jgi:small basic protein (TIGR04137 family)
MSMHKSLIPPDKFGGHRNVLKRSERVAKLESEQRLTTEGSVFGLLKVKMIKVKQKKKAEEETAEGAAGAAPAAAGAAAPAAGGAAPAAGAKPAAEAKKEAKK